MGDASFLQHSFLGGEVSVSTQGRMDRPDYRTFMNVSLNGLPLEQGAWVRRPGTQFAQTTRSGTFGREIPFEFESAAPYRMEFTTNHLRFRIGNLLVPQVETRLISSQTTVGGTTRVGFSPTTAVPFINGDDVYFPGSNDPLIKNRLFRVTVISQNVLSLTDPITGGVIVGMNFNGLMMYRVVDFSTPFGLALLPSIRSVQAEQAALLLTGAIQPQLLQVTAEPGTVLDSLGQPITAGFELGSAVFLDGPYLDPVPGGAQVTPNATSGVVTLTVTFPAWSATTAYTVGSFVSSGGINYESLVDANVNNSPAGSPSFWQVVSSGVAVGPNGFTGTDVGRLVRLFSQPPAWNSTQAYVTGNEVSYPNGVNGGVTYWRALANSTGVVPGTNATDWAIDPNGALWTWGKIVGLANFINPTGSTVIGSMSNSSAAFDGNPGKSAGACAEVISNASTIDAFVGLQVASPQAITSASVYPSSDIGFALSFVEYSGGGGFYAIPQVQLNLRGSFSAPASANAGTLLGGTGFIANVHEAITINSTDKVTAYPYLWIEVVSFVAISGLALSQTVAIAQVEYFSAVASSVGNAANVEILGQPLLYTTPISTWRLGLYSNTTGWPKCGCYHEGRIWLSGVVGNRIDSSVSNGLLANGQINFAPTNPDGSVSDDNGISYVFNADEVNPIFWMTSDQVGIVCGTQGGEWLIQASNLNNPISPTNMQAKRFAKNRSANIEPRRTPGPLAVVQYYQQKLLEYFPDVYSGRLGAQNIAWKAPHLTARKMQELAFQAERAPIVWARCADGTLIGVTYKRENLMSSQEPNFAAAHQHVLGSGRTIVSLCAASTADGSLSTISLVTVDANTVYHVELLSNIFLETDNPMNAWFLDDAVIPGTIVVSAATLPPYGGLQLTGLWYLNGKTVSVYASGLDCGDYTVSNGSVTVPFGDGVAAGTGGGLFTLAYFSANPQIVVGFTYTSQGQIVRALLPAESGARNGPALGKKRRVHKYSLLVSNTAGLSIGSNFSKLFPVLFKSVANVAQQAGQFFTGVYHDTIKDDFSYDGMTCWQTTRPFPAIISAVESFLQTQDE